MLSQSTQLYNVFGINISENDFSFIEELNEDINKIQLEKNDQNYKLDILYNLINHLNVELKNTYNFLSKNKKNRKSQKNKKNFKKDNKDVLYKQLLLNESNRIVSILKNNIEGLNLMESKLTQIKNEITLLLTTIESDIKNGNDSNEQINKITTLIDGFSDEFNNTVLLVNNNNNSINDFFNRNNENINSILNSNNSNSNNANSSEDLETIKYENENNNSNIIEELYNNMINSNNPSNTNINNENIDINSNDNDYINTNLNINTSETINTIINDSTDNSSIISEDNINNISTIINTELNNSSSDNNNNNNNNNFIDLNSNISNDTNSSSATDIKNTFDNNVSNVTNTKEENYDVSIFTYNKQIESDNNSNDNNNSNFENKNSSINTSETTVNCFSKTSDNLTLIVSELDNKVYLPYKSTEIYSYLEQYPTKYSNFSDVVNKEFICPLSNYTKRPTLSRFKETYCLIRDREGKTIPEALKASLQIMFRSDINPTIIAACKTEEQLEKYIDCLEKEKIEEFKDFKIEFKVNPLKI